MKTFMSITRRSPALRGRAQQAVRARTAARAVQAAPARAAVPIQEPAALTQERQDQVAAAHRTPVRQVPVRAAPEAAAKAIPSYNGVQSSNIQETGRL